MYSIEKMKLRRLLQKDLPVIRTDVENIANTLRWVIEMPREDLLNIAKKSPYHL